MTDGAGERPARDCVSTSRGWRSAELLGASDFSLMLGMSDAPSLAAPRWSLWGAWRPGQFCRGPANMRRPRYDGKMRAGWLGIDARAGSWVAGLAVSRNKGEASYHTQEDEGRLETTVNGVYPVWTVELVR